MMKVSDPIIFGHAVRAFFAGVFTEHHDALEHLGASPNNGLGAILSALDELPQEEGDVIRARSRRRSRPRPTSMVDSDRGITNLHVPCDVIIDASMPAMIRASGQLWNEKGEQQDPQGGDPRLELRGALPATIEFCKETASSIRRRWARFRMFGLMAQKAEELGSHDKHVSQIEVDGRGPT